MTHCSASKYALCVIAAALAAAAMTSAGAAAQARSGRDRGPFHAAVVSRDKQGSTVFHRWVSDPQLLDIQAATLHDLIWWSFSLAPYQVKGPGWIGSDLFDVQATMGAPADAAEQKRSLQKLLVRCFDLRYHFEHKPRSVLLLEQDRKGATLTPSTAAKTSPPDSDAGWTQFTGRNVTMGELAMALGENAYFGRPVLDRTGLTGKYDITLKFSPRVGAPAGIEHNRRPPLSVMLRRKLGLRLVPAKSPMPVLVIDAARPVASRCTEP